MTLTVNRKYDIELDAEWTEAILVTAFDGSYGGANYWLEEEGLDLKLVTVPEEGHVLGKRWEEIILSRGFAGDENELYVTLDASSLAYAIEQILNREEGPSGRPLCGSYIRDQLRRAIEDEDAGNIDADVADVIVQVAALGEVVYG